MYMVRYVLLYIAATNWSQTKWERGNPLLHTVCLPEHNRVHVARPYLYILYIPYYKIIVGKYSFFDIYNPKFMFCNQQLTCARVSSQSDLHLLKLYHLIPRVSSGG